MPVRKPKSASETLAIKVRACQRLEKEHNYYKNEVEENESKLLTMKTENRDSYDIKKFEEVLGESYMMVPDSLARYNSSVDVLAEFIDKNCEELEVLITNGENTDAEKLLSEGRKMISNRGTNESYDDKQSNNISVTNVDNLSKGEAF